MAYVVVTGLPGSGKTTLGRALALDLAIPMLDKDDFLERLLDGSSNPAAHRSELSREADRLFIERAQLLPAAVLVSFWRRPELSTSSGTPTEWLDDLPDHVEVWCRCDPEVALHRFQTRHRHPGHGDDLRSSAELREQFASLANLGHLGIGRTVTVDTSHPVDIGKLAVLVRDLTHGGQRI